MNDAELIDFYGGPAQLAKKLGLSESRAIQRIHNWRKRGIPARMKLDYPELFQNKKEHQSPASPTPHPITNEVSHG